VGVAIQVSVYDKLSPKLRILARSLKSFRQPLETAEVYMYQSIDKTFRMQGRPNRWAPWKDPKKLLLGRLYRHYKPGPEREKKRRKTFSPTGEIKLDISRLILIDTHRLQYSVTGKGGADSVRKLEDTRLEIGTNVKYAPVHQFGSPKKNIPARPFLQFLPEDIKRIVSIFKNYIKEATEK